ncbi:unnamed protein product [Pedinophyceae sp. YPF-701]|nr:unnamed protein product [Pedinophyceae sp. YPF-701]
MTPQDAGTEGAGEGQAAEACPLPPYTLKHTIDHKLDEKRRAISACRFSPDGRLLATSAADGVARVFNVETGELRQELTGHKKGISDLCWSPDGNYITTASDDCTVRFWNVETGSAAHRAHQAEKRHTNYVMCVKWRPINGNPNVVVSGSFDETVKVWDVMNNRAVVTLPAHSDPVTAVDVQRGPATQESTLLASASFDGLIRLWDCKVWRCHRTIMEQPNNPPVGHVAFTKNGKYLVSTTLCDTLHVWAVGNVNAGTAQGDAAKAAADTKPRRVLRGVKCKRFCTASATPPPVGDRKGVVACGSEDGSILMWNMGNGARERGPSERIPAGAGPDGAGHASQVMCVDFSVDGAMASCSQDGTAKIWTLNAPA